MADEGLGSFNPANMAWQGNVGYDSGVDKNMVCMFYTRAVHSPAKSAASGHPVYEDKVFVRIHPPGERLNIVDREVQDHDKRRFPMQWNQFNQNKEQAPDGCPIELLYPDYPSVSAMLRANGICTVEQCADLSSHAIESIGMGAQRYVNEAKKYLEQAQKGVGITQMRHELEQRDREIKVLQQTVEKQAARIDELINKASAPDLATIQAMLAGALQRPQMPLQPAGQAFDAQTAQINANSAQTQAQQAARGRKRQRIS